MSEVFQGIIPYAILLPGAWFSASGKWVRMLSWRADSSALPNEFHCADL